MGKQKLFFKFVLLYSIYVIYNFSKNVCVTKFDFYKKE